MVTFNNREIASAIWILLLFIYCMTKADARKAFYDLIKTFFSLKLYFIWVSMTIYVTAIIFLLKYLNYWDINLLKDTIFWFLFSSFYMVINSISLHKKENIFKKYMLDSLKFIVVIEFISNKYTFSFIWEFFLILIAVLITMAEVYSKSNEEYKLANKTLGTLLAAIGFIILINSINSIIKDYRNFGTIDTLKEFLLTPILTLMFLPFVYLVVLFSNYELIFLRLNLGIKKSKELKKYAKMKLCFFCHFSLKRQKIVLQDHVFKLSTIRNKTDIDKIIKEWHFKVNI